VVDHPTPAGNVQQFLYARFRREAISIVKERSQMTGPLAKIRALDNR
jgi:hypothetical protein